MISIKSKFVNIIFHHQQSFDIFLGNKVTFWLFPLKKKIVFSHHSNGWKISLDKIFWHVRKYDVTIFVRKNLKENPQNLEHCEFSNFF